ncbi:6-hydroxymethylpterin diphosphokinase MptE-like protein [Alishewanella jeotgali]|uniref:DUF115 domain-containing protein n=1 Tax=Alishewanella jeotgali KCTC 22429 TaxID=1129374 RepID=H3ZBK2_9ALTE|nr:6-hydroxymethylpterin diphosphokinase MptE-like protein [Alishewanella jeotgali]EHR42316.1 hypothetical protein AJE_03536 [Alishewanella jeotgali KCTC 22429]
MHNSFKLLYNENFNLTDHPEILSRIQQNQQQSIQAFSYYAPELVKLVKQHDQLFDVFFNHNQQLNICDTHSQLALYSAEPTIEVETEIAQFIQSAPFISFSQPAGSDTEIEEIDVLLLFGVGLGLHLPALLRRVKVKYLLIYESSSSILRCSTFALNWQEFLNQATAVGTAVSIQIAKPGSEILDNLRELSSFLPGLDKVYLYRHICDPIYDEVLNYLLEASGRPEKLTKSGVQFLGYQAESDAVSLRAGSTLLNLEPALVKDKNEIFQQNIAALITYYPGLAEVFNSYQPQRWLPAYDNSGQLNLYHRLRKCFLFRNREQEVNALVECFKTEGQTGLSLLGQAIPWKLRHYLHFQTLQKIRDIEAKYKNIPVVKQQQVRNMVVLGCSTLFDSKFISTCEPDNLVFFEREPDYFYASLFLVNWESIFKYFLNEKKSLSLNVGVENQFSTAFFRLIQQTGHPDLSSTVFLNLSYSEQNIGELTELKSDIKTFHAVGDYFDHVWYGINQSVINVQAGAKFLSKSISFEEFYEFPLFIVGNGPSLDGVISCIKNYSERSIIVSCGTALSALLAYDIIPDFHAEAEQNRSTYSLVNNVKNHGRLKEINLISFSAVHPDTADLFKKVYLAFKEGEAATRFLKSFFPDDERKNLVEIKYAYPTVTNLALSFISELGFKNIYLFGVDFGQAEHGKHHSIKSIYFKDDGTELHDFEQFDPHNQLVPGNFRAYVKTKPEFDMARRTLSHLISNYTGMNVYNCSDGAKVINAISLSPDNVLLSNFKLDKQEVLSELESKFRLLKLDDISFLNIKDLFRSLVLWCKKLDANIKSIAYAETFLEETWRDLVESVFTSEPLLDLLYFNSFSMFYGSLRRILSFEADEDLKLRIFRELLAEIESFTMKSIEMTGSADNFKCRAGSFVHMI